MFNFSFMYVDNSKSISPPFFQYSKFICIWIGVMKLHTHTFDSNIFFVTLIFLYYGFGPYTFKVWVLVP